MTQNKTPNELILTMSYRATMNAYITEDSLPDGQTMETIKSVKDGKWGSFLIEFKDGSDYLVEGDNCDDDYKWCDEIFIYDGDFNEVDEDIIEVE